MQKNIADKQNKRIKTNENARIVSPLIIATPSNPTANDNVFRILSIKFSVE